jgi:DNA polymerase-1
MGDSSDNIPGIPGIGPKTAAELINRFGSLDEVLSNTDQITQEKRRKTIQDNTKQAILSRNLIKLCFDVPLDIAIEDLAYKATDTEVIISFLQEQGFKSLISKVLNSANPANISVAVSVAEAKITDSYVNNNIYQVVSDINLLLKWIKDQKEISQISIYLLSDEKDKSDIAVALSVAGGSCIYPLKTKLEPVQTNLFTFEEESGRAESFLSVIKAIKDILEDTSINKIFYNAKPIIKLAKKINIEIKSFEDIMMMSYCLEAGMHKHDLHNLLVKNNLLLTQDIPDSKSICTADTDSTNNYLCNIASSLLFLYKKLRHRLFQENDTDLYLNIEKPLIIALADMEIAGIKINISDLKSLSSIFASEIEKLEQEIYQLTGITFNIGSPKQLGEVLFDKLGFKGGKKSKKTGAYSTDINVLQSLADEGNLIIVKILQWRHVSKMKTTYTDALPKQVASDGRIHSCFEMAVTNTGRLSSRDPNLQNIPIRSEDGNKIRKAFIAEKGHQLICADYSQIELRLLSHVADIAVLQDAFKYNMDIHAVTASQMFGTDVSEVTSEQRRKAKMINFGIIYGISAFGLAQRLGISRNEASDYIKQYFEQYPGIEAYMQKTIEFARENGFVQTIWGRKCYVNGINDRNAAIRQFSERAAINAPLQGTAADIIKKALIVLDREIKAQKLNARIILQVHDELVLEVQDDHADQVKKLVKNIMENVISLSVPTTVDVMIGNSWQEIH